MQQPVAPQGLGGDENADVLCILLVGSNAEHQIEKPIDRSPQPTNLTPPLASPTIRYREEDYCPKHRRRQREPHFPQSASGRPADHSPTPKLPRCGRRRKRSQRSPRQSTEWAKVMIPTTLCGSP